MKRMDDVPPRSGSWFKRQSPAFRLYLTVVVILGLLAVVGVGRNLSWPMTMWPAVGSWALLAVLASLSMSLRLRRVVDGSGIVTVRDVWPLSALLIWGLPEALLVNLILVLWFESVTKVLVERRNFVLARWAFNCAASSLGLIVCWWVVQTADAPHSTAAWGTWLGGLVAFELVALVLVTISSALNGTRPLRDIQWILDAAAMVVAEVPLALALAVSWNVNPVLAICLAFPIFMAAVGLQYIMQFIELREMVSVDSRTGLLTPDAWREGTERLLRQESVAVLMADLDNFKSLNDLHGHLTGDEVLRKVGSILLSSIRPVDMACRWGGEEFVLALRGVSPTTAVEVAERIRLEVNEAGRLDGLGLTISIGVSMCEPTAAQDIPRTLAVSMGLADSALYEAKRGGRNQVQTSPPDAA